MKLLQSIIWIYISFEYLCNCSSADDTDDGCSIDKEKENKASLIGGLVTIYIICLTAAIVILIYLIKFYQHRDDPNIENRHPRLVYATVLMVIFSDVVLFPLAIDFWTLECVTHTAWLRNEGLNLLSPVEAFLFISFVLVLLGWLILVVLRVWLLRFDYGASLARKAQIWKKDLEIDGGNSTWWINNQQTWGKETYLMKIVAIPYVGGTLVALFLSPIFAFIHHIEAWTPMTFVVGGISLILCCFIVVNVWKVREIHDNFHIKHEVLLFAKAGMVTAIFLLIIWGISQAVSSDVSNYIVLIWSLLVMLLLAIVSYIQTGWVLYGIRRKNEKSQKLIKSIADEWESNVSLVTILSTKEGFEVFMDFLVAEYSTENLLCYVEATQFLRKWKYVIYKMKMLLIEQANPNQNKTDNNNNNIATQNGIKAESQTFDLTKMQNGDNLVLEATTYVQKQMENNSESDTEIDQQPWAFHDKESILIKFQWVKKPPVMKTENITLWDHFRHLRQKYISATSAHQVNIRSALYKHYTKIKREDCQLSKLDISDVFNDPLHNQSTNDVTNNELQTNPNIPIQDISDDEEESLQPGQVSRKKEKRQKNNEIEMSATPNTPNTPRTSNNNAIRRSQTNQYNRNLRNLYGVAKVMQLIEDTRKELWKNMNDSFSRFITSEYYVDYKRKNTH